MSPRVEISALTHSLKGICPAPLLLAATQVNEDFVIAYNLRYSILFGVPFLCRTKKRSIFRTVRVLRVVFIQVVVLLLERTLEVGVR